MPRLLAHVEAWYSTARGTFTTAAALYQGLVTIITEFVTSSGRAPRQPPNRSSRTYAKNPVVVNCQQTLATYQRRWQQDPGDHDAREAMLTVARHLTDLRQQVRTQHWNDFLSSVRRTRSLQEVWHHVNRARVKGRRQTGDPDPADRAQELLLQWKGAASLSELPVGH
ncbi:hypothetical protein GWK47_008174 [Chionoecetes opilio]|uniref:Uncharacterized protein n=1 Tax=Chionoecetes opilio TaxID=41210 RepID=A0A8J4Y9D2_CHIOP|nr:hypothetical protein GWK47_008174 [Chionoecetes opilio]